MTYSVRRPDRAVCAATSSSSVDFPTPGSPASSSAAPGTSPPPSTRSSSAIPLVRKPESTIGTCPIGTAGVVTGEACARGCRTAAASATLPQAWHSPQRPTHLTVSQPHSLQRYDGRGDALALLMAVTLGHRTDIPRQAGPQPAPATDPEARGRVGLRTAFPGKPVTVPSLERSISPYGGPQVSRRIATTPTLATVAAVAGVSRQTVSNALNSPELLRPDTLERVREAITELGYSPNRAARSLRTRSSHLVGLRVEPAVEDSANALMDRFVHSLVESTRDAGYHVLLFSADGPGPGPEGGAEMSGQAGLEAVSGYEELLRSAAVDAFVVTDTYRGNPAAAWLGARGVPFVAFGRPWAEPAATHPWVDVDGRAGVMLAVDHLVERGHSRIAWVGWKKDSFIGEDRRSGWTDRMHEHGLSTSRLSARGEDHLDFGCRAAHALLDQEQPSAFVCVSDTVAMGVMRALAERGMRAGRDVAVVGFDDSIAAQVCTPALTSVRQPLEQVAVEVVRYLGDLLGHRRITEQGRILSPTLSVRDSS